MAQEAALAAHDCMVAGGARVPLLDYSSHLLKTTESVHSSYQRASPGKFPKVSWVSLGGSSGHFVRREGGDREERVLVACTCIRRLAYQSPRVPLTMPVPAGDAAAIGNGKTL